jgi:hypothetical protein
MAQDNNNHFLDGRGTFFLAWPWDSTTAKSNHYEGGGALLLDQLYSIKAKHRTDLSANAMNAEVWNFRIQKEEIFPYKMYADSGMLKSYSKTYI